MSNKFSMRLGLGRTIKRFGILLLIFLVSGTVYLKYFTQGAEAAWFDESWAYRQAVTVTVSSNGSDIKSLETLLTVNTSALISAGKLQSACQDLRFTNNSGKLLSYYIDSGCNTTTTKIWVVVDTVPANTTTYIAYLYYGNPSASAGSDSNKFNLFRGLVGYWGMNETSWNGTSGEAKDFSVNGNNATSANGATTNASGKYSYAGSFDGINDYVYKSSITGTPSSTMTICSWVNTSTSAGYIMQINRSPSNVANEGIFQVSGGKLLFWDYTGSIYGFDNSTTSNTSIADGSWHFACFTKNGTSGTYYLDGNADGTKTAATNVTYGSSDLAFGANYRDSNTYWNGKIDDFRIYNRTLSASEISQLYQNPGTIASYASTNSNPTTSFATEEQGPAPVAYWKFDEGTGTSTSDSTSNKFNGTLTNGVAWQSGSECLSGNCLYFDGADDYVDVGAASRYGATASTGSYTVEAWVKPTDVSRYNVVTRYIGGGDYFSAGVSGQSGWIRNMVRDTVNNVNYWPDSNKSVISANTWNHITFVFTTGSGYKYYVNGSLVRSVSNSNIHFYNYAATATLGKGVDSTTYFKGYMDEIKVYAYERSSTQIKSDYVSRGSLIGAGGVLGADSNNNIAALSQGLVGYWKMNEATWSGTLNEVLDSSGNGNNGQAQGAANAKAYPGAGKYGNGGVFDGVDDYVDAGNPSNLNFVSSSKFTISLWVKTNSLTSSDQRLIAKGQAGACYNYLLDLRSTGTVDFGIDSTQSSIFANGSISAGTWYHVVAVYDNGSVTGYLNGSQGLTKPFSGLSACANSFKIGSAIGTSPGYVNGSLDDIRVYNRALSPADVANLYNFAPGPVGYWKLDEKSGTSAVDSSGNGNTGTLTHAQGIANPKWVAGKVGGGVSVAGTGDFVSVPDASTLDPASAVTVSTWFYATSTSGNSGIITKRYSTGSDPYNSYLIGTSGTVFNFCISNGTSGTQTCTNSTTTQAGSQNKWIHLTGVYDGATIRIYVNGIQESSAAKTGTIGYSVLPLGIGTATNTGADGLPGRIDEVRVYNYARTAKQITEDMQGSRPSVNGRGAGTVGYWKFDEGYGTTAKDYSGNGNSGTLTSMASPATASSGWSNDGRFGKALSFDGSNDYVTMGDPASGIFDFGTSDFSISVWYNRSASGTNIIIGKRLSSAGYVIYFSGSTLIMQVADGTLRAYTLESSLSDLNTWHHIVTVVKRSTNQLIYYRDGILKRTVDISASTGSLDNAGFLAVGRDQMDGASIFSGLIDEVKIYNFPITPDDVKKDFNRGSIQTMGSLGTDASGNPSNSADRAFCPPGDTTATCGPVGEWNFEEAQGTSVNDTSGNGNTGTWSGTGSTHWSQGKVGKSGGFNGVDDYVTAGSNPITGTSAFTMSAWLKAGSHSNYGLGYYIGTATTGQSAYLGWVTTAQSGTGNSIGGGFYGTNYGSGIADSNWHYVTLTFAGGASGAVKLYVDGVVKVSTTATPSLSSSSVMFGKTNSGTQYWYHGNIDQARLYNYALSQAQVSWEYNRGAPVAWYKMDECQGTTVRDMTGNGNNGTLTVGASGTQTSAGTCQTSSTAWGNGVSGKVGSSLNFDGTDDYVDMNSGISAITKNGTYSFSAWIKPTGAGVIFQNSQSCSDRNGMDISSTTLVFGYYDGSAWHGASGPITLNQWSHVVGVDNGGTLSIYINGDLQTGTTVPYVHCADTNLHIGRHTLDASGEFHGQIDDARVYNYPLTSQQIKQVYNGGAIRFGP